MRSASLRGSSPGRLVTFWTLLLGLLLAPMTAAEDQVETSAPDDRDSHHAVRRQVQETLDTSRALVEGGRLKDAANLLRPMLGTAAELQGSDLRLAGEVVELLARALHRSGSDLTPEDRGQLLHLLNLQEEVLGHDHPATAKVLLELACISQVWGSPQEAEAFFRRVIRVQELESEQTPSAIESWLEVARTYVHLGNLLSGSGYPGKAKIAFGEAVRLGERALGPVASLLEQPNLEARHVVMAEAVANLGASHAWMGDADTARRQLAQAAQLFERSVGLEHPLAGLVNFNMAWTERSTGHSDRALPRMQRAFTTWNQHLGDHHLFVGIAEMELAALLRDLEQWSTALHHAQSAAETLEAALGPHSHRTAVAWSRLGELRHIRGDLDGAQAAYDKAKTIHLGTPHAQHPDTARNLDRYGRLLWQRGSHDKAFAMALEAEAMGRRAIRTHLSFAAEREALGLHRFRTGGRHLLGTLLAEGRGDVGLAWSEIMRSRGLVFEELNSRYRATRDGQDPEALQRWQDLVQARQRLANLYVRHNGSSDAERQLGIAIEAREAAERRLEDTSASYRQLSRRRQAGFDDIRARLPADTGLLAYIRYEHLDVDEVDSRMPGEPSYLALVWQPSMQAPVAIPLGPAAAIDSQVAHCRQQLRGHSEARFRRQSVKLRRLIWDPVAPYLDATPHLSLVADGSLSQFPLFALALDDGRYWIDRGQDVRYLSTEREWLREDGASPQAGVDDAVDWALLSLGGPDFDLPQGASALSDSKADGPPQAPQLSQTTRPSLDACAPLPSRSFLNLEYAREEGRHVADLHRRWAGDARVLELLGAQASEAAFKTWAPRSRNLHLATHGYSAPAPCLDQPVTGALLGSGLALAGANLRSDAHGVDDGLLTAEEIAALDLSGVDWAVLSACETGLGEPVPGEGILGLRRAFRVAGVRTLIMSLWPVDDAVTGQWMTALYEARWNRRLDAPGAVAAASRRILEDRRRQGKDTHPYFWAPFITGS